MEKKTKLRLLGSVLANALVFVLTLKSVLAFFDLGGEGNMAVTGVTGFRYYTTDSNVLAAVFGLFPLYFSLRSLIRGKLQLPYWVIYLKFVGTCLVTVTFAVVLGFLGPMTPYGYRAMYQGNNLFTHLINPLLAVLSLWGAESYPHTVIRTRDCFLSLIPTAVYGAVYFTQVLVRKAWPDFYMFTRGGLWAVAVLAVGTLALLAAFGLRALQRSRCRKMAAASAGKDEE